MNAVEKRIYEAWGKFLKELEDKKLSKDEFIAYCGEFSDELNIMAEAARG